MGTAQAPPPVVPVPATAADGAKVRALLLLLLLIPAALPKETDVLGGTAAGAQIDMIDAGDTEVGEGLGRNLGRRHQHHESNGVENDQTHLISGGAAHAEDTQGGGLRDASASVAIFLRFGEGDRNVSKESLIQGQPYAFMVDVTGLDVGAHYGISVTVQHGAVQPLFETSFSFSPEKADLSFSTQLPPLEHSSYHIMVVLDLLFPEAEGDPLIARNHQIIEVQSLAAYDFPQEVVSKLCAQADTDAMKKEKEEAARRWADAPLPPPARCRSSLVCRLAAEHGSIAELGSRVGRATPDAVAGDSDPRLHPSGQIERKLLSSPKEQGGREPAEADTLILCVSAPSAHQSGMWEDNLDFFLAQGLIADPRYRFLLVMNDHGRLDSAWTRKLDAVAAWAPNFEWLSWHGSRDTDAWRALFNNELASSLGFDLARISRFLLINSSVRGPFVPPYFRLPWPEAFLGLLSEDCVLAGMTANCMCALIESEPESCRFDCSYTPGPSEMIHIPTFLIAFHREPMLEIVNSTLLEGGEASVNK